MNTKRLFNDHWFFTKQPANTSLESMQNSSLQWQPVSLPHDWLIYDTRNLYETGDGWYRKEFEVTDPTSNRSAIRFEGVYMNSKVYVNGKLAGTWKYGYSTFEFDITELLVSGKNEILVQVTHESPNSRWYSGAGIYRNVWLKTYPETHIVSDGIYISTKKGIQTWTVDIDTEIAGKANVTPGQEVTVKHQVIAPDQAIVASSEAAVALSSSNKSDIHVDSQQLTVSAPLLWDIISPNLYRLKTQLHQNGTLIHEEVQVFGFRTLEFTTDKGFFLNGNYVKMYGVCQHHDLGCLGAAVNKTALRRQLNTLREMGVNAIRTSHNMPAVELMELADEMGFLILSEAFDMWERSKTKYDYGRFFPEWAAKDVASWIRRDRNHPSVIMWSIGNEIYDTHADVRGQEVTRMLRDYVLEHDPRGNARVTIGSNYMPWEGAQKCADILKLAGYNYAERYYDDHHAEHPDWIIYGSETASTVQSRGIYHFPYVKSLLSDDDEQCSSLGNSSTSWGAKNTEYCITADRDAKFSLGQFIWTGFDYIGEPTPYHTKNSYFGQIDTAGFKKETFYIYQSEWTSYKDQPMVHIFPYWDFSEGQLIDVRVCSNAPKVELFFNNVSQGTYEIDHDKVTKLTGDWQIPYTKGVLRAVAYDEKGNTIAEDIRSSYGDAASLVLKPDKTVLSADGSDLCFIEISTVDDNNNPVENANNRVTVTVEGPGRLVGLDNGDSTDYDQYKGISRRLFSGKLLAIVSSTFEPGTITVKVSSKGFSAKEIALEAKASEIPEGSCEPMGCTDTADTNQYPIDEIPIRKLEIISTQGNQLNKEKTSLPIQVKIHPENATYQDIEWRVTNDAGIDTNIATIKADTETKNGKVSSLSGNHEATLTALGDGKLYVRCMTKNGADKIRMFSQLEFEITGMGQAYINPYEFVSGGLYTYGTQLTNGNERGVATSRDGESIIAFQNINFGDFGSDEITLPIFSLDSGEFQIKFWEGIPGVDENAALLTTVTYQKPAIWNTYQEETYKLPRRLKGITTLSLVLYKKIHLKGFIFKQPDKAFQQLSVLENSNIYGDTFTVKEDTIENIGNNVSIVFNHIDFGEKGCSKLTICGHSPMDKNTIHVRFSGADGEVNQLIDFTHSDGYCEKEFPLDKVTGNQTVTFVFLPGCDFDFKWFRFQ